MRFDVCTLASLQGGLMGTTVVGNPRQQSQANKGATWALIIILAALAVLAFIGYNGTLTAY